MIVNQPHDRQLGIQVIEALESEKYNELTIMVAYAKLSGVYRLLPYIQRFRNKGGIVRIVVGIDQQNTTYDALQQISTVSNEFYIFHSENISQTFHIKCYWLKGEKTCWFAIGSNNLTAGGLFSNYELSVTHELSGADADAENAELEQLYLTYATPDSVCSKRVDAALIDQLLAGNYVVREIEQRKALVDATRRVSRPDPRNRIFGNEAFPAPALPQEYRRTTERAPRSSATSHGGHRTQNVPQMQPDQTGIYDNNYLIRHVPKAGDRSKQVHFTIDLLHNFFCREPGDSILVQEMLPTGSVGEIEQRQVVFSVRNRNVKIELSGASMLDTNYPEDLSKRPVLILKRVNDNLFVYMIIMDGNGEYDAINERLKRQPTGRSLPYEIINEETMFSLWNDCPIT